MSLQLSTTAAAGQHTHEVGLGAWSCPHGGALNRTNYSANSATNKLTDLLKLQIGSIGINLGTASLLACMRQPVSFASVVKDNAMLAELDEAGIHAQRKFGCRK